jgi:hypothetical protein
VSWPTLPHIIYIPLMLTIGFGLGWTLGTRAVRQEWQRTEKRRQKQAENS